MYESYFARRSFDVMNQIVYNIHMGLGWFGHKLIEFICTTKVIYGRESVKYNKQPIIRL